MKFRSVVLAMFLAVGLAETIQADEPDLAGWKLKSLTIGSGESPVTSGLAGIVQMDKNGRGYFELGVQQELAWVNFGRKLAIDDSFTIVLAGSAGHLLGAPWVSPYIAVNKGLVKDVSVSVLWWPALLASEPSGRDGLPPNPESYYRSNFGTASLNIGPVGLSYAALSYLDDPWNDLPGISYTQQIKSGSRCTASVTRNVNAKKWMYYVGATWSPQ